MSKSKVLGRGSKKRVRQIRWTRYESLHAVLLLITGAALSIYIVLWLQRHGM